MTVADSHGNRESPGSEPIRILAFPGAGNLDAFSLYYHVSPDARYVPSEKRIVMERGGHLSSDTFFNVLPSRKIADLTIAKTISLHLRLCGRVHLTILSHRVGSDEREIVYEADVAGTGDGTQSSVVAKQIEPARFGDILSLRIDALEDEVCFAGGGYYTDTMEGEASTVRIQYSTTVFRREAEFRRNEQMIHSFLQSRAHLRDAFEFIAVDNGGTLARQGPLFRILPNENVGGSGGCARGILETLRQGDRFTHFIICDDDILIDPAVLENLYLFLRLLRKPDVSIAGAMLRLEESCIEYECGGLVRRGEHVPLRRDLHLDRVESLLENERQLAVDYGGWWFFATSTGLLRSAGLPLPFFLKYDDAEFGCRLSSKAPLLTLNGIGVWHESFDRKDAQLADFYFYPRNRLIFQAMRAEETSWVGYLVGFARLCGCMVRGAAEYRYKNVGLIHAAVRDFLRGPDHVFRMDMKERLKQLSGNTYPAGPVVLSESETSALAGVDSHGEEGLLQKVLGIAAVCGHLWPAFLLKSKAVVPICPPVGSILGHRTAVVYDVQRGTGIEVGRCLWECAASLGRSLATLLLLLAFWRPARKKYLRGWHYYATAGFWQDRLKQESVDPHVALKECEQEQTQVRRRATEGAANA